MNNIRIIGERDTLLRGTHWPLVRMWPPGGAFPICLRDIREGNYAETSVTQKEG